MSFHTLLNISIKPNLRCEGSKKLMRRYFYSFFRPTTSGGEGGGRPPQSFFENKKKCPGFRKKGLDWIHPYVKSTIQNVVLRVSKRKNLMFIGVP